ncbi:hypothetical protein GCM10010123_41350 [Pilimelia anulata]|uniref:Uncharacterized protein n=1 Tax=Pilimelia anulata TaxID=53371 RepID=A0A8J3BE44_9ACTN|nr:hypothetical protein [Pilimelia anulata]GGK07230.1 hypothetical protein GCM10010123_41350 [Pilimelia anulata]
MIARWRRRTPADQGSPQAERFGWNCPVCGSGLGADPRLVTVQRPSGERHTMFADPPSFRLEVGYADRDNRLPWRVRTLGRNFKPEESPNPRFNEREVSFVYLLCGDGHIFPDPDAPAAAGRRSGADELADWNMIALLGAPASGKTYLVLRMLNQSLDNPHRLAPRGDDARVRRRALGRLEEVPLTVRAREYAQTLSEGLAILPTGTNTEGMPAGILAEHLPDALEAVRRMIRVSVVNGPDRAADWGLRFRQPLVLRTDCAGRQTWTGLADLPGELFAPDAPDREAVQLRHYDGLLWVVDPLISDHALHWLRDGFGTDASYGEILDGSLRPGTTALGADVTRANRDLIQMEIGQQLSLVDNMFAVDQGKAVDIHLAITKCDLIRAALPRPGGAGHPLADLGEPGAVGYGAAVYLSFAAQRWADRTDGAADPAAAADEGAASLLGYLRAGVAAADEVRERRARQVAAALLDHYSDPAAFWRLVHGGEPDTIGIGNPDAEPGLTARTVAVPSIAAHLDRALEPGGAGRLLLRDLVMSTVGCGIAYGLGHDDSLYKVLSEPWLNLRVFLCSPLGTVPRVTEGNRLAPLAAGTRFQPAKARSAALTQLLVSVLGKARS